MIEIVSTESASKPEDKYKQFDRRLLGEIVLVFVAAGLLLFLLSSRIVNGFDEGILLTATMRTMAGQVLHRDFYYNYGPAQLYLLAGLFKLFGTSVLVERVADAFSGACLVASLYAFARTFCNRTIAIIVAVVCMMWLIGVLMNESLMNSALCVLILWTSWLILPVTADRVQRRRSSGAGFLTATMFLFRYDVGMEMVVSTLAAIAIMTWLQGTESRRSPRRLVTTVIGPYLAVFAVTILPAAIAYLSVAPLHDLLYDTVLYGAGPYRQGRGIPFPIPNLGPTFQEIGVYLLPVLMALGLWIALHWVFAKKRTNENGSAHNAPAWMNLLVALIVAAVMMYVKGMVRVGIGHMYPSLMPCILIAAIAFQHRKALDMWLRGILFATLILFVAAAVSSFQVQLFQPFQSFRSFHLRPLAINWIVTPDRQPPSSGFRSWCHDGAPITTGFCFLLDEPHIQTVRYLDAHTEPGNYLYVGLPRHDRILMNDNILYFAVQRLPAVRWSQLDPLVENLADIQRDMINGFEEHKPPYIVLDSEFENYTPEPNASAVSTGVHLLDDYIAAHYKTVQRYGALTILQRQD